MPDHFATQPVDINEIVRRLCIRTRLLPRELATILCEIPDDHLVGYRARMLGQVWPDFLASVHLGDDFASNLPEVHPYLVRAYVASYCHVTGLHPSLLASVASEWSANSEVRFTEFRASPSAPSMLQEITDHFAQAD